MEASTFTGLQIRNFTFGDEDALYRDHLGRRILADCEGSGLFHLVRSDIPVYVLSEADESAMFPISFNRFGTVVSSDPGFVDIISVQGTRRAPLEPNMTTVGPIAAVGWVYSATAPIVLDGSHRSAGVGKLGIPLPFYRGFQTTCEASIWLEPTLQAKRLDRFEIADDAALKERGWKVQNISKVRELKSTFADGLAYQGPVASHLNVASWQIDLVNDLEAIYLRKTYDQFHGRQRARVLVDGEFVGWWYEPFEDRVNRWAVADFAIGREFLEGKKSIRISIDPPAGTPLWSISSIEVTGLMRHRILTIP